jgi:hypothetical protein
MIEDPCSRLQGIFDRKESGLLKIRSLTPPQAAGNALAFAVQEESSRAFAVFAHFAVKSDFR